MVADVRPEVLVDVLVVRNEVPLVDEGARTLWTLPPLFSKVARDVTVEVLLGLEGGTVGQTFEVLGKEREDFERR